jgi:hypothetical protein
MTRAALIVGGTCAYISLLALGIIAAFRGDYVGAYCGIVGRAL